MCQSPDKDTTAIDKIRCRIKPDVAGVSSACPFLRALAPEITPRSQHRPKARVMATLRKDGGDDDTIMEAEERY